jgi:hypothetical protein
LSIVFLPVDILNASLVPFIYLPLYICGSRRTGYSGSIRVIDKRNLFVSHRCEVDSILICRLDKELEVRRGDRGQVLSLRPRLKYIYRCVLCIFFSIFF